MISLWPVASSALLLPPFGPFTRRAAIGCGTAALLVPNAGRAAGVQDMQRSTSAAWTISEPQLSSPSLEALSVMLGEVSLSDVLEEQVSNGRAGMSSAELANEKRKKAEEVAAQRRLEFQEKVAARKAQKAAAKEAGTSAPVERLPPPPPPPPVRAGAGVTATVHPESFHLTNWLLSLSWVLRFFGGVTGPVWRMALLAAGALRCAFPLGST